MNLKFREPLPAYNDWTIEPDMADHLVELLDRHKPHTVLELGSGLSTVVMAYALEQIGSGCIRSMESNSKYANQTTAHLKKHGLTEIATVYHTPIKRIPVAWDGSFWPWYDMPEFAKEVKFDFIFVDGPEGSLCTMARWPALFVLRDYLDSEFVMVCDDTNRAHERKMVDHWLEVTPGLFEEKLGTRRGGSVLWKDGHEHGY